MPFASLWPAFALLTALAGGVTALVFVHHPPPRRLAAQLSHLIGVALLLGGLSGITFLLLVLTIVSLIASLTGP